VFRELGCLYLDLINSSLVQVFIYLDHKGVGINVWFVDVRLEESKIASKGLFAPIRISHYYVAHNYKYPPKDDSSKCQ